MASGTEMLFLQMLKAFMPKEAAEKIAGMVEDGTFDRIGSLPADIQEIKDGIKSLGMAVTFLKDDITRLELRLGDGLQGRSNTGAAQDNLPPGDGDNGGHFDSAFVEPASNRNTGGNGTSRLLAHDGHCEPNGES